MRMTDGRSLLAALLALTAAACREPAPAPIEKSLSVGERKATLRVAATDATHWWTVFESTERAMKRVQDTLDARQPQSDISRINRVGASTRIQVARDTHRLLDLAQHAAERTHGLFDPTVAPVAYLWGFEGGPIPTNEPTADMIAATRVGQGARNLVLFDYGAAALVQPQTKLSVNSLLDAYATDLAIVDMRDKDIANALVQVGQSARALGVPDAASFWQTALPHPFVSNAAIGAVTLDKAPAVSWVTPRKPFVAIGGKNFGHVMDPRTGRPAQGIALAAAAGPTATISEILARCAVVLGTTNCGKALAEFPRYELLVIPEAEPLEIWVTPGFRDVFSTAPEVNALFHTIERPEPPKDALPSPAPTATAPASRPAAK